MTLMFKPAADVCCATQNCDMSMRKEQFLYEKIHLFVYAADTTVFSFCGWMPHTRRMVPPFAGGALNLKGNIKICVRITAV